MRAKISFLRILPLRQHLGNAILFQSVGIEMSESVKPLGLQALGEDRLEEPSQAEGVGQSSRPKPARLWGSRLGEFPASSTFFSSLPQVNGGGADCAPGGGAGGAGSGGLGCPHGDAG